MANTAKMTAPALNIFAPNPDAASLLGVTVDDDDDNDADVELAATDE